MRTGYTTIKKVITKCNMSYCDNNLNSTVDPIDEIQAINTAKMFANWQLRSNY